jgi:hypothetical protein
MIDRTKLKTDQYYRGYNFGTNIFDRGIIGNQRKLETLNLFPPVPTIFGNDIPSHIFSIFFENGQWVVYESVSKGFVCNPLSDYDNCKVVIVGKKGGYTKIQVDTALATAHDLANRSKTYGYISIVYWTLFTYSNGKVNLFHTTSDKYEICYASSYLVLQSTDYNKFPAMKPNPWGVTISKDDEIVTDTRNDAV